MNITGKIENINAVLNGHSQVRISAEVTLPTAPETPARRAEIIISTMDPDIVAAFKLGDSVSFTL